MGAFRRIVEDYEARLTPPHAGSGTSAGSGKAEHERFEDGEVQFEVRLRGLEFAEGSELEVRLNGTRVALAGVTGGRASVRLSSHNGDAIPSVRPGDRLEVSHRSVVLLEGSFRPD